MSSTDGGDHAEPVFRILGSLRVRAVSGEEIEVPVGRQQSVLAALLLDANRVIGLDQLIDLVWPDDPPATARTQIQICVSELRKLLHQAGHSESLVTRKPGYVVQVPEHEIDAGLFTALVRRSRQLEQGAKPEEAAETLREALALWHGPVLDGTEPTTLHGSVVQLEEGRVHAFEALAELEMQLGDHHSIIGKISQMVREYPLRERLRGQLITALYRSGRSAEALEVYQVGRRRMIDELGIEPGPELQALNDKILMGSVAAPPAPANGASPATQQPSFYHVARPFQLPADTADFTARDELVRRLTEVFDSGEERLATPVAALIGKPGIGKSALAVHVAHQLRDSYPDGQLYCELGGSTLRQPAEVGEVLGRFVRALGVPGSVIPDGATERGELFRTLLSERRVLVLLDDAANEQQVRPLLPGSGTSAVIITSRARLTGLAGASVHELDVFDLDQSRRLLAGVIGTERLNAELEAAEALTRMVGGLPLALRIVAARLAARPRWPLAWMLERLTDERHRLDELTHGDMMVRASLAMSYDGLATSVRRMLRLLSMIDAATYPAWVAAALLDVDLPLATRMLEVLVDVQMLELAGPDLDGSPRYRFHVIIKLFAREQLHATETAVQTAAAAERLVAAWLAMTDKAHKRIYGGDYTVLRGDAPRREVDAGQADRLLANPLDWLEAERTNACEVVSLAAAIGADEACWELAVSLVDVFESRCYVQDWQQTHRTALRVAVESGNRRGEAAVQCSLGSLFLMRGRREDAERVLAPARVLFDTIGDDIGRALVMRNLAWLAYMRGDKDEAAQGYRKALAAFEAAEDPIGRAHLLGRLAQIELDLGSTETASELLAEAMTLCRAAGSDRVETQIRFRLSLVEVQRGRLDVADAALSDLLEHVRSRRDAVGEARILQQLGIVRARTGRLVEAERLLQEVHVVRERSLHRAGSE